MYLITCLFPLVYYHLMTLLSRSSCFFVNFIFNSSLISFQKYFFSSAKDCIRKELLLDFQICHINAFGLFSYLLFYLTNKCLVVLFFFFFFFSVWGLEINILQSANYVHFINRLLQKTFRGD